MILGTLFLSNFTAYHGKGGDMDWAIASESVYKTEYQTWTLVEGHSLSG